MSVPDQNNTLSLNKKVMVILLSFLYLCIAYLLTGLRVEHWLIIGFYNLCFFINVKTRRLILAFTIFLLFGVIYDLMKVYPNYMINNVDVAPLYHFERKIFGIIVNNQLLTPNEFFAKYHNMFLDLISGLFYINWMPIPLAFAFYLYLKNKEQFLQFSLTFFLVNIIGFSIYYIHPAAPPWYVQLYGFDLHTGVLGNTAGLARFDSLIGVPVFSSIYTRNSNVFAALPSLHSAYPVVVLYYAYRNGLSWINWLLGLFMVGIWFSAVYSGHHYVTDVLLGIFCACTGIIIFRKVLLKIKAFQNWLNRYKNLITS